MITSSYVVSETVALLQQRGGRAAARLMLLELLPALDVSWVHADLHARGVEAWLAGGRALSLVDCVSFALMHELHLDAAFAFNRHFEEQGFRLLP